MPARARARPGLGHIAPALRHAGSPWSAPTPQSERPPCVRTCPGPPLPGWKAQALAAVRYGQAAKLFLPLASAPPPSQTLSVPLRFWTWTQHGAPVASSFAGSPSALDRLEVERGPETWADAVRRLRPELAYADGPPLLSTWHDDPWARGAYSARTLSSPLDDEALARPVGAVAFAGEHTAGRWHALMEGALRSASILPSIS